MAAEIKKRASEPSIDNESDHPAVVASSIRFCPNHATRARFARKNAFTSFTIAKGNNPNGYLEVVFDFFFDFGGTIPMRERKSAMDFRLFAIFRRKEIVKFLFAINRSRIRVAKFCGAIEKVLLDR